MSTALKSVEETAARLSISPWTVRAYIAQGKIARVKVGRRTLVEDSEIERFVERCKAADGGEDE